MKLYHYCSLDTAMKILEGKKIRLTSLAASNDYGEGKWTLNEIRKISENWGDNSIIENAELVLNGIEYYAFCLSEVGDSVSQWMQYGNSGQGVCLEIDFDYLHYAADISNSQTIKYWIDKVEYGIENDTFEALVNEVKNKKVTSVYDKFYKIKNPSFSAEKETRLNSILHDHADWRNIVKFESSSNHIKSYIEISYDGYKETISKITLGPKNISEIKILKKYLLDIAMDHIDVARSESTLR
jgi:Protein of unknown function (DUF2971)